jgi:hypothetical protein
MRMCFKMGTGQMKVHIVSLDFSHANQCRVMMVDYVNEIVVAYDTAFSELSDGFSVVKK